MGRMPLHDPHEIRIRELGVFQRRVELGDPVAIYQAITMCNGNKMEFPPWLANCLLSVISNYFLGKKPGKVGAGNNPLAIVRKRIEKDIKYRAVVSVREWQKDKNKYNAMPTASIKAWFDRDFYHAHYQTLDHALIIAQIGLGGKKVYRNAPTIKCSPITLKRVYYDKDHKAVPPVPIEAAIAFGFNNPDSFFGTDILPPDNLK